MEEGCGTIIFGLVGLFVGLAVVWYAFVYLVLPGTVIIIAAGTIWGGGQAAINYFKAFRDNVSFEKPRIHAR